MPEPTTATPAFYARRGGRAADWWTLLHPPYTLWHLSYVVLGAALAVSLDWTALVATVLAFFLAVGLAAHALDELKGRPLDTRIPEGVLVVVAVLATGGACALGVAGSFFHGSPNWWLLAAVPVGALLLVGYNLELFSGRLHTDAVFAWAWGGFPLVVGFVAQSPPADWSRWVAAATATLAAVGTSYAQRRLSTPARTLRRRTSAVAGTVWRSDGSVEELDRDALLAPLEGALRALSWALPAAAVAALLVHL
jgi:uncharacterized membrane protein YsdA (DUF1294 family)